MCTGVKLEWMPLSAAYRPTGAVVVPDTVTVMVKLSTQCKGRTLPEASKERGAQNWGS